MNRSIERYIETGKHDLHWYRDTEILFLELYGPSQLHLVTQLFAATSINSSLPSNVRLFRKALYEIEHSLPFSSYLPVMLLQLNHIRNGQPMSGRKINSFAKAMSGDKNAVVVDIWLLRAFGLDVDRKGTRKTMSASDKQYDLIELWVREYADLKNFEPREVSAMIWSGVRTLTTGKKLTRYDEVLRFQNFNMYENNSSRTPTVC